jgi:uncharacterized protein YecE (DUF72 family)
VGRVIRLGTSGYSFPDWVARRGDPTPGQGLLFGIPGEAPPTFPFYPAGVQDRLAFYARHFDTVEINSTYYGLPRPRDTAGWAARTPPGFAFWVKVPGETTHRRRRDAAAPFREAIAPLQASGKLAGLLAQFPGSFRNGPESRRYLQVVRTDFPGSRIAVEFRHRSWDDPATEQMLCDLGLLAVAVDAPDLPELFPRRPICTGPVAYLRLHSRRADAWYAGEGRRYDYLYSDGELEDWLPWLRSLQAGEAGEGQVYVYFNNCKRGQAVENARRLAKLLGIEPASR